MIETPKINSSILTRGLPKTGQTSVYVTGDDGTYQAGWWRKRLNANNRSRFTQKTIAGDDIIVDRATGLWWATSGEDSINNFSIGLTWSAGIQYPLGRYFGGKSDWRIPNALELISIINFGNYPAIYNPFLLVTGQYWSSTTYPFDPTAALVGDIAGLMPWSYKTNLRSIFCCRGGI